MDPTPDLSNDPVFSHEPVMIDEITEVFRTATAHHIAGSNEIPGKPPVFADLTLGGAGHMTTLLEEIPEAIAHGFDQDDDALEAATRRLEPFAERAQLHRTRFDHAARLLRENDVDALVGFLMDLGVSSPQLDWAERGFSYRLEGPLDMRMDTQQVKTAANVVNEYSVGELIDVLRSYGDERHATRIAHAIVDHRPIDSTTALATVVAESLPAAVRRKSTGHPAKRTFQALRIEVNDELAILGDTLDSMIELLAPGGVGLVLTYHSGEDRIVKDRMRRAIEGETLPGMPSTTGLEWLWRGARTPTPEEIERNPRARSARLRAITRVAST